MVVPELLLPIRNGVKTGGFGDVYSDGVNSWVHRGHDLAPGPWTPDLLLLGPCDGPVVPFTNGGDFGPYALCIDYDGLGEWYVLVAHGRAAYVQVGQVVRYGQPIGEVGDLGKANGVHAHIQVCRDQRFSADIRDSIDPEPLFTVTEDDVKRLDRLEAIVAGNGMDLIPWADTPGEASVLECFPPGTEATKRDHPAPDDTALWVTGDAALRYCELRGFSLGLGVGLARKELGKHASNGHGGN